MPEVKLSISIVHHDGRDMLKNCLSSIFCSAVSFQFEVIVVDNASTDGSREMMNNEFPQVVVIGNSETHGFGHNQNKGLGNCRAEYILVLNDDTVVPENALQSLCDFLDRHPHVGVVGPKLLNADGSLQTSCYRFPTPLRYVWDNFLLASAFPHSTIFGDYRQWDYATDREVDSVKGAAMLVRRSVVDRIGGFDERFFMYFEEIDWQMRIRKAGYKIMIHPQSEIVHLDGQSTVGVLDNKFVEFQLSSDKFMTKHYGTSGAVVQRVSILIGAILSISLWSIISKLSLRKRQEGLVQIQRSKRLLRWWLGLGPSEGLSTRVRHETIAIAAQSMSASSQSDHLNVNT